MNKIIKLNEEEKQILDIYSKINKEEIDLENIILKEYKLAGKKKSQVFYNLQEEEILTIYYAGKEIKGYEMVLKNPTGVNNFFETKNLFENVKEPITIDTFLNNLPSHTKKISFGKNVVYHGDTENFSFEGGCLFKVVDNNYNIYTFVFDKNNKFEGYRIDFSNKEEFCIQFFDKETIITKTYPKSKSSKYYERLTINKDKELELLKGIEKGEYIYPPISKLKFEKLKDCFFNSLYIEKPNKKDFLKFEDGLVSEYFYNGEEIINLDENIVNREKLDGKVKEKLNEFIEKQTQLDKIQKLDFFKDKELNEIFEKKMSDKKQDKNVLKL